MGQRILAVDDNPVNVKLLEAVLAPLGYTLISAGSGEEALAKVAAERPDLVLLDIVMPGIDGYEVCRRLRADAATRFLPIVMVTASPEQEKVRAIDAGADDFIPKPFDKSELIGRVRSLLRIKDYHDTVERQAGELAEWNRTLEARVQEQVQQLERMSTLRRFLSGPVAEMLLSGASGEAVLEPHRREITVVYCDMRGSTEFQATAEPEDVVGVVREYHGALGELIFRFGATLKDIAGDGLLAFFNDPVLCPDPALRGVRMALAMRDRVAELARGWRKRGHELGFGVGVTHGYATLGLVGFEGRLEYGALGSVVNLAARLCAEAKNGQVLISQRVYAEVEDLVQAEQVGEVQLKGFPRPIAVYNVLALKESVAAS